MPRDWAQDLFRDRFLENWVLIFLLVLQFCFDFPRPPSRAPIKDRRNHKNTQTPRQQLSVILFQYECHIFAVTDMSLVICEQRLGKQSGPRWSGGGKIDETQVLSCLFDYWSARERSATLSPKESRAIMDSERHTKALEPFHLIGH